MTLEHIWMQITAGRGPVECQLAVGHLARAIAADAKRQGLAAETLDTTPGQQRGALLSALLRVEGAEAKAFAQRYDGTVQWICPSPVRPGHKRKNWFVGVALFAPPTASHHQLDLKDVTFEAMRAGGAGGQHVNKTESAVRAMHRPSGIVVTAREERSQHQNKRLAIARLAAKLSAGADAAQASADADRWAQHDELERGRPALTFVGPEFRLRE